MATLVSDRNAFFSANYPEILRIVSNEAHWQRRDIPGISVEDLVQEGLVFALRALERVDLEIGWHGYVKTVVHRRLVEHVAGLMRRNKECANGDCDCADEAVAAPDLIGAREDEVAYVKRRVAGRRAIATLREKLSPAARCVLDLTIRPPIALLIMTRNEEGRVARPQARHVAQFSGLPHLQVERAHVEIWQKSHRVAA